ncbi:MAG: trypsin-like peptidase domain-containing protein [Lachnospiraceae bacterium]|nr:trypsin-like peptidase domain-containing protein [Lachnospiraceae bacterium]
MYESYDYDKHDVKENVNGTAPLASSGYNDAKRISEEQKRAKKAAGKASGKKFFIAAGCGIAFGILAAVSFKLVDIATDRIQARFFPKTVTDESEAAQKDASTQKAENKVVTAPATTTSKTGTISTVYDVSEVAEKVMPTVVSITNKSIQEVRMMFGYGVQQFESESAGSGIIIGENEDEYLIITNNHVVEGANDLTVGFVDDAVVSAEIKGNDPGDDLAVIAVKKEDVPEETKSVIALAEIGDSDSLVIGEPVIAIGNAMGYGQSVTSGIVSALNRDLNIENTTYSSLIQTDAAINPGNSGGALLNMDGQVIGINSAKLASSRVEGIGYAIPVSKAMPIFNELMNRSSREVVSEEDIGYLGIASNIDVPEEYATALGIPEGVYVTAVTEGSPADKAGIKKSDVIKKFDGLTVTSMSDLKNQLKYYKAGEEVEMIILRSKDGEYEEQTVNITLGSRKGTELDPAKQKQSEEDKKDTEDKKESGEVKEPEEENDMDDISDWFNDGNSKGFYFNFGNGGNGFGSWGFDH